MNYYEILEVSQSASQEIIKIAYKNLAKKHHPDIVGAEASVEKMKRINEAYDVLSNPLKRREYDEQLFRVEKEYGQDYESKQTDQTVYTNDKYLEAIQKFKSELGTNIVAIATTVFSYLKGWNNYWLVKIWYIFTIGWLCMFISDILAIFIKSETIKKVIGWVAFGVGVYIWYRITR